MSLSSELYNLIKTDNRADLNTLHALTESMGHKQSYGERQLRHLTKAGLIIPVKNDKKFITGYQLPEKTKWIAKPYTEKDHFTMKMF